MRAELIAALREAHTARRGLPAALAPLVHEFARLEHEAGVAIERVLVDVKEMLNDTVHSDASLYSPRIVAWIVAGYFARPTE